MIGTHLTTSSKNAKRSAALLRNIVCRHAVSKQTKFNNETIMMYHSYSKLTKTSTSYVKEYKKNQLLTTKHSYSTKFIHNRLETSGLKAIFEPSSVAIVGATDRNPSVGRTLVNNLIQGNELGGKKYKIFPVNPTRKMVLGLQCYPSIEAIPNQVDMVVIVTPAKTCLDVMKQSATKGVKAAVVISAGFKEAGPIGIQLEKDLIQIARDSGIRVVGPNCVGVMNPNFGLNATFAATMGLPGNVAFVSQSGAMCTAILDWSIKEKIGFSAFISVGSMADVHWGDLLDYLGSDPNTASILIYMEAIGDVSAFIAAAKEVGFTKPISVIKAGKSDAAAKAAASHTGSLAGSYGAFEAAMNDVGVLTASTIQELSDVTHFLSKQPRPQGPKLMIITNAGGPAVLATDATVTSGAEIATLSPETLEKLNKFLPHAWSHGNPVDILGDASAELYAKTLEVLMGDPHADGILVVLSPQDVTDPLGTAKALVEANKQMISKKGNQAKSKPILAAWMGGETVKDGFQLLSEAGIPTYSQPDVAASTFGLIWEQVNAVNMLYGKTEYEPALTPFLPSNTMKQNAMKLIQKVKEDNRTLLTEAESKKLISLYGIPTAQTILAQTPEEVEHAVNQITSDLYAVKLNSKTLTHKADVGGVQLNLKPNQVAAAFHEIKNSVTKMKGAEHFQGVTIQPMINLNEGLELIFGSTYDPQFGPIMLFGSGGRMVEIYKDTVLAIPPLDDNLAEYLLKKTLIYKALTGDKGKRFPKVNISDLKQMLIQFSHMIVDLADVLSECDVNPVLATQNQLIALDARIVLKEEKQSKETITAKRAYPSQYVTDVLLPSTGQVTIRPISPADKSKLEAFHQSLSPETVKQRYLEDMPIDKRTDLKTLISVCHPDFDRQIAVVVEKNKQIIALCVIVRPPPNHLNREKGQMEVIVTDSFQKKGVGKLLMQKVMDIAKQEGIQELQAITLKNNTAFNNLVSRLGWKATESQYDKESVILSVKL